MIRFAAMLLAGALAVSPGAASAGPEAEEGAFSVLTYNVAGLPEPLSGSEPARNTPLIGERIAPYDVVHVQEDFNYHAALYEADDHPHRTPTSGGVPFGSGLNTLANFPVTDLDRVTWEQCWINQADCLTPKGFTFSRVEIAPGASIDFYNAHADAGDTALDEAARRANLLQLADYIAERSADRAVVVMGDLNSRYTSSGDIVREFAARTGLTDPWVELVRDGVPPPIGGPAPACEPADQCEVVDKIFYRSGADLRLTATDYANDRTGFLREDGEPLSDHDPISAEFTWHQR
ncbi:endonuclease/exonuclease/phosphatase family protein [Saccharopolyspora cebuensis]|uniref:Endonuclease/exonuclease/phosphatase family protein n=1 Tax=Saccharopolyspora cebuensis TaxID=418759 RepID=A0ABV4CPK3_9PSEU